MNIHKIINNLFLVSCGLIVAACIMTYFIPPTEDEWAGDTCAEQDAGCP